MIVIKNKKTITIIIVSIVIIISIIIAIMCVKLSTKKSIPIEEDYNRIVEKINNKNTFYLLIINDEKSDAKKILNYYKDVYDLNCDYLIANYKNENYKKIINQLNNNNDHVDRFIAIKEGKAISSFAGVISEQNLRTYLITNNIIDKKYKNIDYVFKDDEFNNYYNESQLYIILYINKENKNIKKYRELLVKNNIKSLIMYQRDFEQIKTNQYFNKELNLGNDETKKLPIIIKIKDGKIISSNVNISIEDFSNSIKDK